MLGMTLAGTLTAFNTAQGRQSMSYPKLTPIVATGSTAARYLGDRFADIISLKDFGAKGDGVTDDTAAWNAWQAASGGIKYIPAGEYRVNGVIRKFAFGCLGNGLFDDEAGFWSEVHLGDGRSDNTLLRHRVAYSTAPTSSGTSENPNILDPVVKIQTDITYNDTLSTDNKNFTRVIGGYFEGIGHGEYAYGTDGKTGNFTVLAATAHNKFAGQFGMTAITGRVWDAKEDEVPKIATRGASKSCAGYFPFTRRSRYDNGGYMIGIETFCMNNAEGETKAIPYQNSDSFSFTSWTAGYHCTASSKYAPITAGIFMDGSKTAKHGFWNGIVIGGSSFRINSANPATGTVGINLASWKSDSCADIGIKFAHAGRWHLYFNNGFAFHAGNAVQESHASNATFAIRCGDTYNSALYLQRGATDTRTGTATTVGTLHIGSSTVGTGSNAVKTDYTELKSSGYQRFVVTHETTLHTYTLSSYTFAPLSGTATSSPTSLGTNDHRWNQLYAVSGTINTSDARAKQDVSAIPEAVLNAWGKVDWKQFRLKAAVTQKGEHARTHSGLIAQDIQAVFAADGLDAAHYGLFCHDVWEEQYEEERIKDADEVLDENGRTVTPEQWHTERRLATPAGDLYSVRYEEALALEAAYQRDRADKAEARIAALEEANTALMQRMAALEARLAALESDGK